MDIKDFVTYEQALALKKLGFNDKVNHVYLDNEKLVETFYSADNNVDDEFPTSYANFNVKNNPISVPTLAQAQKWLRGIKDIVVIAEPDWDYEDTEIYSDYLTGKWYFVVWKDGERVNCNYDPNKECEEIWLLDTYEQALSAGITECLKLLERK